MPYFGLVTPPPSVSSPVQTPIHPPEELDPEVSKAAQDMIALLPPSSQLSALFGAADGPHDFSEANSDQSPVQATSNSAMASGPPIVTADRTVKTVARPEQSAAEQLHGNHEQLNLVCTSLTPEVGRLVVTHAILGRHHVMREKDPSGSSAQRSRSHEFRSNG